VRDAVNRLIVQREAMDQGFPGSLLLSGTAHILLLGGVFLVQLLLPKPPLLQVAPAFAVALPPGGGGPPAPPVSPDPPAAAEPEPALPEPEPPPKILKPPKDEERKQGLPAPDAKKRKPEKRKTPTRAERRAAARAAAQAKTRGRAAFQGVGIGPVGPGVPGGLDPLGDWYLASVQRKIWSIWTQQLDTAELKQEIRVRFTILADGQVTDVRVTQASGVALLNLAAQRAVFSAAPFGPLPRKYGTQRFTIQAIFKGTS